MRESKCYTVLANTAEGRLHVLRPATSTRALWMGQSCSESCETLAVHNTYGPDRTGGVAGRRKGSVYFGGVIKAAPAIHLFAAGNQSMKVSFIPVTFQNIC